MLQDDRRSPYPPQGGAAFQDPGDVLSSSPLLGGPMADVFEPSVTLAHRKRIMRGTSYQRSHFTDAPICYSNQA